MLAACIYRNWNGRRSNLVSTIRWMPVMIDINQDFIDAAAPNAEASKNGRGLVLKNKFVSLHRSDDETIWFGQCQGSGKTPYLCSADFAVPEKPVYRCNCP